MAPPNPSPTSGSPAEAITAVDTLRVTSAACAGGIGLVFALGRGDTPTVPAAIALLVIAVLALVLAELQRRPESTGNRLARALGLYGVGLAAAVVGWFFGPQTEFNAVIILAVMILGVASTPGRENLAWLPSWAGALGLLGGQAVVGIGAAFGAIPNVSLVPVFGVDVVGHVGLVLAFALVAGWSWFGFVAARRFRERYHALALDVDEALRAAVVRDALVEEARHEYMRALSAGRTGRRRAVLDLNTASPEAAGAVEATPDSQAIWDTLEKTVRETFATRTKTTPATGGAVSRDEEAPSLVLAEPPQRAFTVARASAEPPPRSAGWADAYRGKLAFQRAFVVLACAAGMAGAYFILPDPVGVMRAVVGMAAVALLALFHGFLVTRSGRDDVHWPWVLVGAISVVPASAYGMHSAMAAFIVLHVFLGGLFRGSDHASGINRRSAVVVAFHVSYFVAFLAVFAGIVEEHALIPMHSPGMPAYEPIIHHAILQATFFAAFAIGGAVDRSFRRLRDRAEASANEAAVQGALLATASAKLAQLESAISAGLFAGQSVGRFTLGSRRASGGMGEIYDALDPTTSTAVAVKLVRVDVVSDPLVLEHFAHEVAALRRVDSPFVARVLDAGGLEEGLPHVAMELIEGPSLAETLRATPVLTDREFAALVHDVGLGLGAIHRGGVVHRDIKPQNLLRASRADGAAWKIVDLGIAHIQDAVRATVDFAVVGTPRYMAPEQFLGGEVDGRADLYAFSLVLYRALTGRPAFGKERVGNDGRFVSPPPPRWLAPMSEELELCLRIGTATRPEDRFQTAESLREAFAAALEDRLTEAVRARGRELLGREPWASVEASPDRVSSVGPTVSRGGAV